MTKPVTPFLLAYPAPWRIQGTEVVDAFGCNVQDFAADTPEDHEFWRGVVTAVNLQASLHVAATARRRPWRLDDLYVVDADGNALAQAYTPKDRLFWRGVVDAVNAGIVEAHSAPATPSLRIHPTTKIVEVNGQKHRIWEGTGPAGEHVYCEVLGVHVHPEADQRPCQTMLQEAEPPSPVVRAIDARFVL